MCGRDSIVQYSVFILMNSNIAHDNFANHVLKLKVLLHKLCQINKLLF